MSVFQDYPEERLYTPSVWDGLSANEDLVRISAIDAIIAVGAPVALDAVAVRAGLDAVAFDAAVAGLDERHSWVRDDVVKFVYPVSALPTNHRVTLADGRSFSAMCVIDGMGTAFTFSQDVRLESVCSTCGEPVRVNVEAGEIASLEPLTAHVVHADLSKQENWAASC
ncbi:MAG TPA: hypothetical protein DCP20_00310 [Coriobacteriia bacterium]|nr:hypothetical protein [Coriobacteriia bacterium]